MGIEFWGSAFLAGWATAILVLSIRETSKTKRLRNRLVRLEESRRAAEESAIRHRMLVDIDDVTRGWIDEGINMAQLGLGPMNSVHRYLMGLGPIVGDRPKKQKRYADWSRDGF